MTTTGNCGVEGLLWAYEMIKYFIGRVIKKSIFTLKGEKLFSVVKLIKSERSEVCRLADNLD